MQLGKITFGSATIASAVLVQAAYAQYRVARVASGLNQPNFVTQAPGDPASILYYVERTQVPADSSYSIQGFSKVNHMGKVVRYDTVTGVKTTVLDLYNRKVFQDDGLQCVAFSPDFQTTGKMYVTSSQYLGTQAFGSNGSGTQPVAHNLVEEYTVDVANPSAATTTLGRTILTYDNNVGNNHTIDWAGFDPTATGAARSYLYVSTGDGAFGNNYNGGAVTGGRPSQNPASARGKILRLDVSAGATDVYPSDSTNNFGVPASNPINVYNAAHPAAPISGRTEVWVTGMRNSYRVSFDRQNGDLYMGDVGESSYEEISFLKAGTNTGETFGPVDFGWPQEEATHDSTVSGAPHNSPNPFTGAPLINPVQEYNHSFGSAVIGGYVYRGPIQALQGKYFYGDFLSGLVRTLSFDRATPAGSFNGANGIAENVTGPLNSRVFDPNDPNYTLAAAGDAFGIDKLTGFGEDNNGNLYLVDFGGTAGDSSFSNATGEYPAAGLGEIFMLVPVRPGDANNSGTVDSADFTILSNNFNTTSGALWTSGDFNNDGRVNALDFNFLAANYGQPQPGVALGVNLPEPAAIFAAAGCFVILMRRRSARITPNQPMHCAGKPPESSR
jgi:glucose/arabinose dehydrogenase